MASKNDFKEEKGKFKMRFNKKKISEVSRFVIWSYKQNRKLGNLGKFSSALNFDCFDCIKCRKAEDFN